MSAWKQIRTSLAHEARLAMTVAPAIVAAARAFQAAHGGRSETLHLGRSSVTVRHDDRYRGYVTLALIGGAVLGSAAALLLPRLDRVPEALRAARHAATSAFHDTLENVARTPTV